VGIGSIFTFVMDLDKKSNNQNTIKRYLNPLKKSYQKIVIKAPKKIVSKKISNPSIENMNKAI
jgi:hypothetical protein